MDKNTNIPNTAYVFRKWSRAGYAIFNSLKRVVNIGQLDISISEVLASKSGTGKICENFYFNIPLNESETDDSKCLSESVLEQLLILLTPQKTISQSSVSRIYSFIYFFKNYIPKANSKLFGVDTYCLKLNCIKSFYYKYLMFKDCRL